GHAEVNLTVVTFPAGVNSNCSDPFIAIVDEKLMGPLFDTVTGALNPSFMTPLSTSEGFNVNTESFHFSLISSLKPLMSASDMQTYASFHNTCAGSIFSCCKGKEPNSPLIRTSAEYSITW